MAFLKIKNTVVVPKVVVIAAAVINAANEIGLTQDIVITSGNDSVHMKGSRHYTDDALDVRIKTMTTAQKHAFVSAVRARLGLGYDVILESEGTANEHAHVEYDPH